MTMTEPESTHPSDSPRLVPSLLWWVSQREVCVDPQCDLRHSSVSPMNASLVFDCGDEALVVQVGSGHRGFHRETPQVEFESQGSSLRRRGTEMKLCVAITRQAYQHPPPAY